MPITEYPAVAGSVRVARESAAEYALAHGLSPRCSEDVRLAVSEAATNVVRHAYGQDAGGTFRLALAVEEDELRVRIEDDGCGLCAPATDPGLGAGLSLMTHVARTASFVERGGGGSTVDLCFAIA